MILLMTIILSALPRITTSVLNIFTPSVLNTPLICSTWHKHFPVISSFMTYHRVCNQINTMGVTSGSRTAYTFGVHPRGLVRFVLLEVEGSMLLVVLTLCVMFLFCLSSFCILCLMLPVSLEFPFFIAPSVFSNVYNTIWLCNLLSERSR